jgi:hypothetical protein
MAINIICPGCHTRFKVSDQYAGKDGPCPKCKVTIQIPEKSEELVIHTPEEYEGAKDSKGQSVLKPIRRKDAKFSAPAVVIIVAGSLLVLGVVWLLGRAFQEEGVPLFLLGTGALLFAPPLVFAAYTFLREAELQPHRGTTLWIRVGICSVVYAVLWGVFAIVSATLFNSTPEIWNLVYVVPFMVIAGGVAAHATFDMEFVSGMFHYGMYLLVTVLLRLVMGLRPF